MQAILTKFIGPTNTLPTRVRASSHAGTMVISYDHEFTGEANHVRAARALAVKLGWRWFTPFVTGYLPDGNYCHVAVNTEQHN